MATKKPYAPGSKEAHLRAVKAARTRKRRKKAYEKKAGQAFEKVRQRHNELIKRHVTELFVNIKLSNVSQALNDLGGFRPTYSCDPHKPSWLWPTEEKAVEAIQHVLKKDASTVPSTFGVFKLVAVVESDTALPPVKITKV